MVSERCPFSCLCFIVEDFDKSLCGNGLPEDTEECDPGLILNNDPCCTSDCQLKQGAICSDKHQQCCSSCRVASNQTMCSDTEHWSCKQRTYCTGDSLECPQALPLPNFTTCLDGGQCFNGLCVGYCEAKGQYEKLSLRSCLCKTPEFACKWCCYDDSDPDKQCKPHSNSSVLDGRRCYLGYSELIIHTSQTQGDKCFQYSRITSVRPYMTLDQLEGFYPEARIESWLYPDTSVWRFPIN
uniref:Disintegrin domain-containing protein n=1 Tax=Biomphalaria glabrata TaxID=6526 RepID=A0A2C9LC87_BIOGL